MPDDPVLDAAINVQDARARPRMAVHYSAVDGSGRKTGMNHDRRLLWAAIVVLALLIVAEFVANRLESHWRNAYRHPNPAAVRQLSDR